MHDKHNNITARINQLVKKVDKDTANDLIDVFDDILTMLEDSEKYIRQLHDELSECSRINEKLRKEYNSLLSEYKAMSNAVSEIDEIRILDDILQKLNKIEKLSSQQFCQYDREISQKLSKIYSAVKEKNTQTETIKLFGYNLTTAEATQMSIILQMILICFAAFVIAYVIVRW